MSVLVFRRKILASVLVFRRNGIEMVSWCLGVENSYESQKPVGIGALPILIIREAGVYHESIRARKGR